MSPIDQADQPDQPDRWYWDLERQQAVPASERTLASNMLGPYGSRAEAERWQQQVEARNDAWDDADEEWDDGWPDDPGSAATGEAWPDT